MAAKNVLTIGDHDFRREVLEADGPVVVDFTATWCPPCRAIAPALESLATDYAGKVKVTQVDVDENHATAEQFGIRSMPTLLFFKGGQVVGQIIGAVPKAKLEEAIRKVI